jgi:hypothetical protein
VTRKSFSSIKLLLVVGVGGEGCVEASILSEVNNKSEYWQKFQQTDIFDTLDFHLCKLWLR